MCNRLGFVDVLRAASVLYIVGFWHLMDYTEAFSGFYNQWTLRVTVVVLGLFTFLSGYLLGRQKVVYTKESLKAFYIKRILRIYPLYLGSLVLFYFFGLSNISTTLKAALGVSMFYGPAPLTLWFITMLLIFYCVAPALILTANNNKKYILATTAILSVFVLIFLISPAGDPRVIIYFPSFALGVYWAHQKPAKTEKVYLVTAALGILSVALSFTNESTPVISFFSVPLASLFPLLIFFLFDRYAEFIPRLMFFSFLSYAGFVMYLIHRPVFMMMKELYFPIYNNQQAIYLVFICVPIIIILSWLTQRGYDTFLQRAQRTKIGHAR